MTNFSIKWKAGLIIISASFISILCVYLLNKTLLHDYIFDSEQEMLMGKAKKIEYFLADHSKLLTTEIKNDSLENKKLMLIENRLLPELEKLLEVEIFFEKKEDYLSRDYNVYQTGEGFQIVGREDEENLCSFEPKGIEYLKDYKICVKLRNKPGRANNEYLDIYIISIIIIISLITFLTIFAHRYFITNPLVELNKKVKQISETKDFSSKLEVSGNDEIGQLKKEINGMIRALFYAFNQHKATEDRLSLLDEALKAADTSVIITDSDGYILWCNPAFEKIAMMKFKELIGQSFNVLDIEENITVSNVLKEGKVWKGETKLRNRSDITSIYISLTPLEITEGIINHYVFIIEDISDRKKAELELIKAKEEAEKSDKVKSEFLAQMSHEIRTPINAILNFISLIKEEIFGKVSEDIKECFRMVDSGSNRLMRTIHLLIDMSMLQTGSFEINKKPIKVMEHVLNPVANIYSRYAADKSLEMTVVNQIENEPLISVDIYSLTQILINLLDNAIKYTREGKIEVIGKMEAGSKIRIDIKDTGIGMTEEYLESLFKPFSQEEQGYQRRYEGNGLGIAVVGKMCKLNDIDILVTSKKGEGSTFSLIFN